MCEGHVCIGQKPDEASQPIPRTKCFCPHLEYLNAAELPHVNQREIEKGRVVRNTDRKPKQAFSASYFTHTEKLKKMNVLFFLLRYRFTL